MVVCLNVHHRWPPPNGTRRAAKFEDSDSNVFFVDNDVSGCYIV